MSSWRPTADLDSLKKRAQLLSQLRLFFADKGVMEVETPLLASAPVTDPNIEAIAATRPNGEGEMYLQTSPEYAMKRLLAAGSGPVYQICKAFRQGERGRRHNPEFTMLEWYRPGLGLTALMDEVAAVISLALGSAPPVEKISYQQAFINYCGIDPFTAEASRLQEVAEQHLELSFSSEDRDMWLQLLMSTVVEPALKRNAISFIYDFPASQAALAKVEVDASGQAVARRFEAFYGGMELANAYDELQDASEFVRRISLDHQRRDAAGQHRPAIDRQLLKAMQAGLPDCVGVAMGLDRLVMLACGASRIDEVIAFPLERA
ncbi:EF-P lysine aminoacylase EpmA [Spongiibacter sp. IMCC21906]|uniref:EF-P lysine aminoacylase EpmA n=1 Tax=Spongiibacter sp. IMCC21906 TaxID=1620392 RepID=UPI00062E469C|nr:EF-P lysine aminoacylase EpmA [Spongiibacter sp. IMCC21906]